LGKESSLVGGIDTAAPTPVSAVNGQINHVEAKILNAINHDPTLATLAAGTDADGNATTGFIALPPTTGSPNHQDIGQHHDSAQHHDMGHNFAHLWA
jgi:hypothetical protein